jgi:hypothetical protein
MFLLFIHIKPTYVICNTYGKLNFVFHLLRSICRNIFWSLYIVRLNFRRSLLAQHQSRIDGEVRDIKMHSLRLRNPRIPSQYHMKTCHKGKLSNRNVGSKDQGAVAKIYAKFTDGTRSIFWDISIGGKLTSSSCLWPLLLFHCW